MAYDKSGRKCVVYIKENDEYIPYLVLESDYGGNVLLLRENVLQEEMQYQPSPHGEAIGALSAPWTTYDYGSYYEKSSIDKYLNTEFPEVFSPAVQAAIVTTTIEVTDMESYHEEHWAEATHMIERKVFLLSAVELGVKFGVSYTMAEEGSPLKYFKNKEYFVKTAYKANGGAASWVVSPFTADVDALLKAMDSLYVSGGFGNVHSGLTTAEELLDSVSDQSGSKNVVLFTTGMAYEGPYSYNGYYNTFTIGGRWYNSGTNLPLYAYANAAYAAAEELKEKCTVYSIGLFQGMENMPEEGPEVDEVDVYKEKAGKRFCEKRIKLCCQISERNTLCANEL